MSLQDILYEHGKWSIRDSESHLPCFAHRFTVFDEINTEGLIKAYIKYAVEDTDNDVIVFSVTEKDKCWKVWKEYAIIHPKTFKVVEGGSIHGKYKCRMYIYTKPAKKRKHHPDNIAKFKAR
jgi:hypothetical protein